MIAFWDRPCAAPGLTSYRYMGRYGWVMIGATNHENAIREAQRSIYYNATIDNLQIWDGETYIPVVVL